MAIRRFLPLATCALAALATTACASVHPEMALSEPAQVEYRTPALDALLALPPPARQLTVAVYAFTDQTGQNKPRDSFAEYSRAVTQGASSVLVNALKRTGNGDWFQVVERGSLASLLQERQIIRQTREAYGAQHLPPLPPLKYAGLLLDGGVIGYDSNTLTGGFGARFLGIGGDVKYRRDTVTVYLRAVSVQTGEILKSVNASKTIYSVGASSGAFKFIDFKDLLEIETGLTTNEPVTLAVRQAIEKAIHGLILEGLLDGYWNFRDPAAARPLVAKYLEERDGIYNVQRIRNADILPASATTTDTGTATDIPQSPSRAGPVKPVEERPPPPAPAPPDSTAPVYVLPGQGRPGLLPQGIPVPQTPR